MSILEIFQPASGRARVKPSHTDTILICREQLKSVQKQGAILTAFIVVIAELKQWSRIGGNPELLIPLKNLCLLPKPLP